MFKRTISTYYIVWFQWWWNYGTKKQGERNSG